MDPAITEPTDEQLREEEARMRKIEELAEQNRRGDVEILTIEDLDRLLAAAPSPPKPAPKPRPTGKAFPVPHRWQVHAITDLFEVQHCRQCAGTSTHFAGRMLAEISTRGDKRLRRLSHISPEIREYLDLTTLEYAHELVNVQVPICVECAYKVRFAHSAFDALVEPDPQGRLF